MCTSGVRTSDVRTLYTPDVCTPQGSCELHHICSTIFPLILGMKVFHYNMADLGYQYIAYRNIL